MYLPIRWIFICEIIMRYFLLIIISSIIVFIFTFIYVCASVIISIFMIISIFRVLTAFFNHSIFSRDDALLNIETSFHRHVEGPLIGGVDVRC